MESGELDAAEGRFSTAFDILVHSLGESPNDPWLCSMMADTCVSLRDLLKEKLLDEAKPVGDLKYLGSALKSFKKKADHFFSKSLSLHAQNLVVVKRYATFLKDCRQFDRSKDVILQYFDQPGAQVDAEAVELLIDVTQGAGYVQLAGNLRNKLRFWKTGSVQEQPSNREPSPSPPIGGGKASWKGAQIPSKAAAILGEGSDRRVPLVSTRSKSRGPSSEDSRGSRPAAINADAHEDLDSSSFGAPLSPTDDEMMHNTQQKRYGKMISALKQFFPKGDSPSSSRPQSEIHE